MKVTLSKQNVKKFQMGGEMSQEQPEMTQEEAPVEGGAPEEQGQDPLMMLAQMSAQALQSQDCQMAMQVCQAFLQIAQQAGGAEAAPEEPVYRRQGGTLVRRK